MNIEKIKDEQYNALILKKENTDEALCEELKNTVTSILEEENSTKNFIIEMKSVRQMDDNFMPALEMISNSLEKEEGFMVIVCTETGIKKRLEAEEYVVTPTFDEAVDYIFMEEIEKQLRSGDEADEEWDDIE